MLLCCMSVKTMPGSVLRQLNGLQARVNHGYVVRTPSNCLSKAARSYSHMQDDIATHTQGDSAPIPEVYLLPRCRSLISLLHLLQPRGQPPPGLPTSICSKSASRSWICARFNVTYFCQSGFSTSGTTFFPSGESTTGLFSSGCLPFVSTSTTACGPKSLVCPASIATPLNAALNTSPEA